MFCIVKPCTEPVFSYALQNWRPLPYKLIVYLAGRSNDEERELITYANKSSRTGRIGVLDILVLNSSEILDNTSEIFPTQMIPKKLPWCSLLSPYSTEDSKPIWSGTFDRKNIDLILFSPARKEISTRILDKGDVCVWLLLEGENIQKIPLSSKNTFQNKIMFFIKKIVSYFTFSKTGDSKVVKTIEKWLKQISSNQNILFSQNVDRSDTIQNKQDSLSFKSSLHRISRNDPQEKMFVKMLQHLLPDNRDKTTSFLFPIFGRGRTLPPLGEEKITLENMNDIAKFLIEPCACVIKNENPGSDILFTVPWRQIINSRNSSTVIFSTIEDPPLKGFSDFFVSDSINKKTLANASFETQNSNEEIKMMDNAINNPHSKDLGNGPNNNNQSVIFFGGRVESFDEPSLENNVIPDKLFTNIQLFGLIAGVIIVMILLVLVGWYFLKRYT